MTTDEAFEVFRRFRETECTTQFWMSDKPARTFHCLRDCILFIADGAIDEALPYVHVHDPDDEMVISGDDLECLIATARATRAAH